MSRPRSVIANGLAVRMKIAILSAANVVGWYWANLQQRGHEVEIVDGHPPTRDLGQIAPDWSACGPGEVRRNLVVAFIAFAQAPAATRLRAPKLCPVSAGWQLWPMSAVLPACCNWVRLRQRHAKPRFDLAARQLLPQHDRAALIQTHDVKGVLADIDSGDGGCSVEFLRHNALLVFGAPCQPNLLAGLEHGRTIPLPEVEAPRF